MNFEEKERLTQLGNSDKSATSRRLRAARKSTGMSQLAFAKEADVKKTTYSAQENGDAYPSIAVMRHLYRDYRVDFNFILHGDYSHLPPDVQGKLFLALSST